MGIYKTPNGKAWRAFRSTGATARPGQHCWRRQISTSGMSAAGDRSRLRDDEGVHVRTGVEAADVLSRDEIHDAAARSRRTSPAPRRRQRAGRRVPGHDVHEGVLEHVMAAEGSRPGIARAGDACQRHTASPFATHCTGPAKHEPRSEERGARSAMGATVWGHGLVRDRPRTARSAAQRPRACEAGLVGTRPEPRLALRDVDQGVAVVDQGGGRVADDDASPIRTREGEPLAERVV